MRLNLTILSLSASANSVGRLCAQAMASTLSERHRVQSIDVRSLPPVWVDDRGITALPAQYGVVADTLRGSDGVILVSPVYCYSASSVTKAVTELFGSTLARMPVALVAAAGSHRSHLALADLMTSMMFEQGTFCYPKTVLATAADFKAGVPTPELADRLVTLVTEFALYAHALRGVRRLSDSAGLPKAQAASDEQTAQVA
jgi:NAD(P)H-dependent FMN reductase